MKKGNKASSYYSACALSDGSAYNIFCEKHGKIIKHNERIMAFIVFLFKIHCILLNIFCIILIFAEK